MRDDPAVVALVAGARTGDQGAWDELVERYAPLVWSICRRYRLERSDIDDVAQTVWLRLVEQLKALRQPAALAGWLATTTQRECLRHIKAADKGVQPQPDLDVTTDEDPSTLVERELLAAEQNAALRAAFSRLGPQCQDLLGLLIKDPPASYTEISERLGLAVGSIGPIRARCLDRLRRSPDLAIYLDPPEDRKPPEGGPS